MHKSLCYALIMGALGSASLLADSYDRAQNVPRTYADKAATDAHVERRAKRGQYRDGLEDYEAYRRGYGRQYEPPGDVAWIDSLPLEDRIRTNLRNNPATAPYSDQIMITNYDSMIIIEGTVRFYADRSRVQAVVQQTNGVYRVDNRLTVAPLPRRRAPPSQTMPRSDAY